MSFNGYMTQDAAISESVIDPWRKFENYYFKIAAASSCGHWVNLILFQLASQCNNVILNFAFAPWEMWK